MPYKDQKKRKKYHKNYRQKHIAELKLLKHKYYITNCHKIIEAVKKYRENNKDRVNECTKQRYWKNIQSNRLKACKYMKNRKLKDPKFKLKQAVNSSIYKSIKGNRAGRKWECLVGYTVNDLMKHLEKQFKEGMTWENYGEWQIDHIIPIAVFNFNKVQDIDFKKCWGLKNLQPLWAMENDSKDAKLSQHFQPSFSF